EGHQFRYRSADRIPADTRPIGRLPPLPAQYTLNIQARILRQQLLPQLCAYVPVILPIPLNSQVVNLLNNPPVPNPFANINIPVFPPPRPVRPSPLIPDMALVAKPVPFNVGPNEDAKE